MLDWNAVRILSSSIAMACRLTETRKKLPFRALLITSLMLPAISLQAAVYTWYGFDDDDWTNSSNWEWSQVPWDVHPSTQALDFSGQQSDRIVVDTYGDSHSPTMNVPRFGGNSPFSPLVRTPEIDLLNGSMTITLQGSSLFGLPRVIWHGDGLPWVTMIGDGILDNGIASLTYAEPAGPPSFIHGINGSSFGAIQFTVNPDGELKFQPNFAVTALSSSSSAPVHFLLNGGAVTFATQLQLLRFSLAPGPSEFDFTAEGSRVTAMFGASFPNLDSVSNRIGRTFRSSTDLDLRAVDNENGTFSVIVVPEPATPLIGGMGLPTLLLRRRRQ